MNTRAILLTTLAVLTAAPAFAQEVHVHTDHDSIVRIMSRLERTEARFSILSVNRNAEMLLTDSTIVLQLTDRGLDQIGSHEHDEEDTAEERSLAVRLLGRMLQGGLRALLDHAMEYPIAHIGEAYVEDGRLVIIDDTGEEIFDDIEIDDEDLMAGFSERDARAFAERLNVMKRRRG